MGRPQIPGDVTIRAQTSAESHAAPKYSIECRFGVSDLSETSDNKHTSSHVTCDTNVLETEALGWCGPKAGAQYRSSHAPCFCPLSELPGHELTAHGPSAVGSRVSPPDCQQGEQHNEWVRGLATLHGPHSSSWDELIGRAASLISPGDWHVHVTPWMDGWM